MCGRPTDALYIDTDNTAVARLLTDAEFELLPCPERRREASAVMAVRRTVDPAKAALPDLLAEFVGEPLHVVDVDFTLCEPSPFVGLVVLATHLASSRGDGSDEALDAVLLSLLLLLLPVGLTCTGRTSSNSE